MDQLDAIVLGTGLAESIASAALSKAGYSVAHIDVNPYYGGDDASLTVDELVQWADERAQENDSSDSPYLAAQRKRFTSISHSSSLPPQSRQFSVSLAPTLVPSLGPLIDSLIASGVSRYGGFKLLERVALFDSPGLVKPVPANKEDVFKNKHLSLIDKRRLMRFLMFAGGDFEDKVELQDNEQMPFTVFLKEKFTLNDDAIQAIAYALAFCLSPSDPTLPALKRIRRYLRSTGRYGPSPFLVGHYGGAGELAQGFCRTSAVGGATYVLGRRVKGITRSVKSEPDTREYTLELDDFEDQLRCDVLVSSLDYMSPGLSAPVSPSKYLIARCVAIINKPICFTSSKTSPEVAEGSQALEEQTTPSDPEQDAQVDTALLVYPPGSIVSGSESTAVNVLVTGEGSMSAPRNTWILYITMPLTEDDGSRAEDLLRPYLDATLSLTVPSIGDEQPVHPIFTLYYKQQFLEPSPRAVDAAPSTLILSSPYSPCLPEVADSAATHGETMFWSAVNALKAVGRPPHRTGEAGNSDVESFWPPLDYVDEDNEEW